MLAGVESARSSRGGEGLAMQRAVQLYLTMLTLLVAGLGVIFYLASGLSKSHPVSQAKVETQAAVDVLTKDAPLTTSVEERLLQNAADPLGRFFLQLFVIIIVSNGVGWVFTRCGQPAVVGEMMAGILLGPSLFGLLTPRAFEFVFAASSLEPLRFLSQIGVCLFMFVVGMEMDWSELRAKMSTAVLISHAGIAFPGLLGAGLALLLYDRLAQPGAPFVPFALFLAISISVTAFPVLVRILQDRRLLRTSLGRLACVCAAAGDITAWALLALIVATARSADVGSAAVCMGLVCIFIAGMFTLVRPGLPGWIGKDELERARPSKRSFAIVVALVLASALATQVLGIHALFGSFVAGLIMPVTGGFREKLAVRMENISSVLLLPVFFAFSGLRTQIGLLHGWTDWFLCLLIIIIATIGKLGGTSLAARLTGLEWRDSLRLGALMNTRGLMELIVLNLGYELHILSQRAFSMLVIMALFTTVMTGPLLSLFDRKESVT